MWDEYRASSHVLTISRRTSFLGATVLPLISVALPIKSKPNLVLENGGSHRFWLQMTER
jgi:hypothetical protein